MSKNKIFKNKVILITGGTGSFGLAVTKRLLRENLKEIRIFSRDEKKQEEMRNFIDNKKLKFVVGDVRDQSSLNGAMDNVDFVFHAAALKQVPSCEFYPMEAIKTNIIGTQNLINSCKIYNVKKAVFLSTDKSVYPINAMGMSKGLMEKVVLSNCIYNKSSNVLCITRYGNVIGSRGSVVPLFVNQIKKNIPITITDPKMTRFLMSLDESVELVLNALSIGKSGEIFVQKSPSATLEKLCKAIMKIFKKNNHKINFIGTRHGEKTYETLISKEEMLRTKIHKNSYIIKPDIRNLNYKKFFTKGEKKIQKLSEYNSNNTKNLTVEEIVKLFRKIDIRKYEKK
tara:strand:- start:9 stop:1031 length:1023 start_codon:yes stop_codon:yes gene_type:complete